MEDQQVLFEIIKPEGEKQDVEGDPEDESYGRFIRYDFPPQLLNLKALGATYVACVFPVVSFFHCLLCACVVQSCNIWCADQPTYVCMLIELKQLMVYYYMHIASITMVMVQLYSDFIVYKTWASNSP